MTDGPAPMTDGPGPAPLRPRRSAAWSLTWRVAYRVVRALDPVIRSWIANDLPGLGGIVELGFVGRRSGRPRRVLITLLQHAGQRYVGHPNGEAAWVRNVEASGWVDVEPPGHHGPRFSVHRLGGGSERDAVIRATFRQQPFPANLLYRAAQRHVAAVGVYHRLEPRPTDDGPTPTDGATPTDSASSAAPTLEGAR